MSESHLYADYVDAAIEQLRRMNLMRNPGRIPLDMVDHSIPPTDDWIGWKPVPSQVMDADLNELEARAGSAFPPLYRSFLRYKHFIDLTEFGVRFERHTSSDWKSVLTAAIFDHWEPERTIGRGLLPFGSETFMDAGQVCFDTRARLPDGDCPVVFLDHEWVDTDCEIQLMFSSSRKMFECLKLAADSDLIFEESGLPNGGAGRLHPPKCVGKRIDFELETRPGVGAQLCFSPWKGLRLGPDCWFSSIHLRGCNRPEWWGIQCGRSHSKIFRN
jgi:hypothetical protein